MFAKNLRRLRLERFLSQGELSRRAGLHAVTLTRLEAGGTAPSTRTVRALAEALDVGPRELATPNEVAELRRLLKTPAGRQPGVGSQLERWSDDGDAARTVADDGADRAASRADSADGRG